MSKNDYYYTMIVMGGYKLKKILYQDILIYEPNNEYIIDLYYSLDPQFITISIKYLIICEKTGSNKIGYITFNKEGNNWIKTNEFKHSPTNIDYLYDMFDVKHKIEEDDIKETELEYNKLEETLQDNKSESDTREDENKLEKSETELEVNKTEETKLETEDKSETQETKSDTSVQDKSVQDNLSTPQLTTLGLSSHDNEFVFDMSTQRLSTKAFNITRKPDLGDDYSVHIESGYNMTKLVDGDKVLFVTPENTIVNSLYYTPALSPEHLTIRMTKLSEDNKQNLIYTYFVKKDGEWINKRSFKVYPVDITNKTTNITFKVSDNLFEKSEKLNEYKSTISQVSSSQYKTTFNNTTLNDNLDLEDEIKYTDKDGQLYPVEELSTTSNDDLITLPLKPIVFDFNINKESTDAFTIVSSSYYYSSVQFSRGYRLTKLVDENEIIYEPKQFENVTSIYYTPRDKPEHLTIRSTSPTSYDGEYILYLYMKKVDGKWYIRSTTSSPDFVEVPLDDNEFVLNVNNLVEDKAYTIQKSQVPFDYYSTIQINEGYKLTKLVDGDQLVYQPEENENITMVYCDDPPDMPNKLTIWYTSTCNTCTKLPITDYVSIEKVDGKWELTIPKKKHIHQFLKPFTTTNEFVFDLAKDKVSGPNFSVKVETVDGIVLATVLPKTTSRLVKVVYNTYLVWEPTLQETCTRVLFAPFEDPSATAVVYHPSSGKDVDKETTKYFVRSEDGTWNETDPDEFVKQIHKSHNLDTNNLKLNFSDTANQIMSNLGITLGNLLSGNKKNTNSLKSIVNIYTYPIPTTVSVTSLYDDKQLVHKSTVEDVTSLQLFTNTTDMFLKATTEVFGYNVSYFYRTSFISPEELNSLLSGSKSIQNNTDEPFKCEEFNFDLSVEHHCTKNYSLKHTKFYGHDSVTVVVNEHNKLVKLVDGDELVWKQHEHKYASKFFYLPPNKPTHLCLGVYHLKDHKVKYRFFYKQGDKWKRYTSFDKVPIRLFNSPKLLESSDITFDLSKRYENTYDYVVQVNNYLDLTYSLVTLNLYSNLTNVVDGLLDVWKNDGTKKVQKFLYYPVDEPYYFLVMYYNIDDPFVQMYDYVDRKANDKWFSVQYPRHPHLFDKTLRLNRNIVKFPQLFEPSSKYDPATLVVSCSKFEFDLSVENHCTKNYSVQYRKYNEYKYVLVQVHKYSKLTKLFDGDKDVWKNDGYQFVFNFAYLPPKNPTEVYMSLYCLKVHKKYKKFFYKLGGEWHEHPHKSKSYLSTLLKELDTTYFNFDLSGYNQNFVHFKEFVNSKKFNLVQVNETNKLNSIFDSDNLVWKNDGTKNVQKFLYYPSDKPKHLALAYYKNDVNVKGNDNTLLLFDYFNKVNGKWENEIIPSPLANTLYKFTLTNLEGLVPKLVRNWRKIDPTEFYNNFLHMSIVKLTTDFYINILPDEGIYEVTEGFEYDQPIRICNSLPGTHVSNILEGDVSVWKAKEPNEHAKSIMIVFEFHSVKEFILYEPKLLQVYVKNRDRIQIKYFNKSTGNNTNVWKEIDVDLYLKIYDYITKSNLKNKYFEQKKKNELTKYTTDLQEYDLDSTLPISVGDTSVSEFVDRKSVDKEKLQDNSKKSVFRKLDKLDKKTKTEKLISFEQLNNLASLKPSELLNKVNKPVKELDKENKNKILELEKITDFGFVVQETNEKTDTKTKTELEDNKLETEHTSVQDKTETDKTQEDTSKQDKTKLDTPVQDNSHLPQKPFSCISFNNKKSFNFDLNSFTILSPYYNTRKVMIMDEQHILISLNIDSKLRYLLDNGRYLAHFPISSDCKGFSFYPIKNPTELLAVFRSPEDKRYVKYFVKLNDQWEFKTDLVNSLRLTKLLLNLDIHIASNELIEYKKLNQQKLNQQLQYDLKVITRYNYIDPKTNVKDIRNFEFNLNKSNKQFGLYTYEVNEFEKIFIPMFDHNIINVKHGDFIFYTDDLFGRSVVSLTTILNKDNKLQSVILTLTDGLLLTHKAYTLDSDVWVIYHLLPSESSQLSDNIQYAQNKLYSDIFTEKYLN